MDFYAIYGVQPYTVPIIPVVRTTLREVKTTLPVRMTASTALLLTSILSPITSTVSTVTSSSDLTISSDDSRTTTPVTTTTTARKFQTYESFNRKDNKNRVTVSTKDPYFFKEPWTATVPYSTRFEPKIIFYWTRTTSSTFETTHKTTRASTTNTRSWRRTTWSVDKIIGSFRQTKSELISPTRKFVTRKITTTTKFQAERRRFILKTSVVESTVSPKVGWRVLKITSSTFNYTTSKTTSLNGNVADPAEKSHAQEVFFVLGSISFLLVVCGLSIYFGHQLIVKVNQKRGQRKFKEKKTLKNKYPLRGEKDAQEIISLYEEVPLKSSKVKTT
mgnify:CR=1 FL=1